MNPGSQNGIALGASGRRLSPRGRFSLEVGSIHVWRVNLAADADRKAFCQRGLSGEEVERVAWLHFARDRSRLIIRCAARRYLLAQYLDIAP